MAVAAFWIALAAVIIAGEWHKKMKEQMRHETVRLLIEKGETLDQAQLRELLHPTPPPALPLPAEDGWYPPGPRGYTQFRIAAAILMIAGPGVTAMIAGIGYAAGEDDTLFAALGVGVFVFLVGFAFFFVSRFFASTDRPHNERTQDT